MEERVEARGRGGYLTFLIFLKNPVMLKCFLLPSLNRVLCCNVLSWLLILNVFYHVTSIKICILKEVI